MKSLLQQQFQWYLRLLATKIVVNQKEGVLFFFKKYIYISPTQLLLRALTIC